MLRALCTWRCYIVQLRKTMAASPKFADLARPRWAGGSGSRPSAPAAGGGGRAGALEKFVGRLSGHTPTADTIAVDLNTDEVRELAVLLGIMARPTTGRQRQVDGGSGWRSKGELCGELVQKDLSKYLSGRPTIWKDAKFVGRLSGHAPTAITIAADLHKKNEVRELAGLLGIKLNPGKVWRSKGELCGLLAQKDLSKYLSGRPAPALSNKVPQRCPTTYLSAEKKAEKTAKAEKKAEEKIEKHEKTTDFKRGLKRKAALERKADSARHRVQGLEDLHGSGSNALLAELVELDNADLRAEAQDKWSNPARKACARILLGWDQPAEAQQRVLGSNLELSLATWPRGSQLKIPDTLNAETAKSIGFEAYAIPNQDDIVAAVQQQLVQRSNDPDAVNNSVKFGSDGAAKKVPAPDGMSIAGMNTADTPDDQPCHFSENIPLSSYWAAFVHTAAGQLIDKSLESLGLLPDADGEGTFVRLHLYRTKEYDDECWLGTHGMHHDGPREGTLVLTGGPYPQPWAVDDGHTQSSVVLKPAKEGGTVTALYFDANTNYAYRYG